MSALNGHSWYASLDKVLAYGDHLVRSGEITSAEDLQRYYEKPWHWDREQREWRDGHTPTDERNRAQGTLRARRRAR